MSGSFVCNNCGDTYFQWQGRCRSCNEWNTLVAFKDKKSKKSKSLAKNLITGQSVDLQPLTYSDVAEHERWQSGWKEFDRVIGGGLVPRSAILMGGEPGIGKSTFALQLAASMEKLGHKSVYFCGEESRQQIKMRAKRLGIESSENILLLQALSVSDALDAAVRSDASLLVIDSIQTIIADDVDAPAGSIAQLRSAAAKLVEGAKSRDMALLIIGHVTKEGMFAGPKVIEHLVDTVIYLESPNAESFRLVRVIKNRFGATQELGVFDLTDKGLIEVENPSALFLSHRNQVVQGAAVYAAIEGTRPLLIEIQTLVTASYLPQPRRSCVGFDNNRLSMLLAVLEAKLSLNMSQKDVYLNVTGGLRINHPAADMAVVAALISSAKGITLPANLVLFGELGLGGEIRPVFEPSLRLKEAEKIGFKQAIMPDSPVNGASAKNLKITKINSALELLKAIS